MTVRELWAGVDIGGSKTLVVLCDADGAVAAEGVAPTPARAGGESILDTAASLVRSLLASVAGGRLRGVGVGAAGLIDPADGLVVTTGDSFDGWTGTRINPGLSARLDGAAVAAENDVNAFLLGELAQSEVDRPSHALAVTLGTGVGGALLVDGRLLHGGGAGAGEIGHVGDFGDEPCTCGQRGHLEAYASGRSLSRRYAARTGVTVSGASVAAAARSGDVNALAVFEDAGRHLGAAISHTGGLLGIDLAILGGSVLDSWPLLEKPVLAVLADRPLLTGRPVRLRLSRLGANAVALGATVLARELGR